MKSIVRSALVFSALFVPASAVWAQPIEAVQQAPAPLAISAPDGRSIPLVVEAPAAPKGVVLVSHGGSSNPETMREIMRHLAANGFASVAPMHTDSLKMPEGKRTDLQGAFMTRMADMQATAGYTKERFPGLPVAALGYSYGSLFALVGGGAFAPMIPGRIDGLKAVVMFSSPGPIPGLSAMPGAYAKVDVPTLLVTGTADTVPGFVPDPKLHLTYFDGLSAGDHTAFIVKDATHTFLRDAEPGMDEVAPLALDFLKSRVLGDAEAAARFDAASGSERVEIRRRR